jgi:DNA helicase HerA-like ATPase
MGPVTAAERKAVIAASPVRGTYDTAIDRESAYEVLQKKAAQAAEAAPAEEKSAGGGLGGFLGGIFGGGKSRRMSTGEVVVKQVARSVASQVGSRLGREIVRGLLGSLKR